MSNYQVSNLTKLDGCLIICRADKRDYIIEVPGYEATAKELDTGQEEPIWLTKNCGLWNITSPIYGRKLSSTDYKTRKVAIEAFENRYGELYFNMLRRQKCALLYSKDPMENTYKKLVDEYRQGRR